MIWIKDQNLLPPLDIPIYLVTQHNQIIVKTFDVNSIGEILHQKRFESLKTEYLQGKGIADPNFLEYVDAQEIFDHFDIKCELIYKFWSFIPLWPPDEIYPHLSELNAAIRLLKKDVCEIWDEVKSIPRITSIQKQIENVQYQLALLNPDPYQKWVDKKNEEFERTKQK